MHLLSQKENINLTRFNLIPIYNISYRILLILILYFSNNLSLIIIAITNLNMNKLYVPRNLIFDRYTAL